MQVVAKLAALALAFVAAPVSAQGLRFVDYTDDFAAVWEQTASLGDAERVAAFKAAFARILPGFYDSERVKQFIPPDRYDELVLQALNDYPQKRSAIAKVRDDFAALAEPAQRQFEAHFGPMTGYPPVLIVHSLGEFDGGTRDLGEGERLMFGADMIERIYRTTPIKPFVQHELFHLLHGRMFAPCDKIYCSLWQEGLATHVAASLNPGADDAALGLSLPEPIRPQVEARKADAVCAVRARLDSDSRDDYAALFYGSRKLDDFPARMGYYVGYLAARDIGRTRTLKQMAALTPEQVRPLVEGALEHMANCSAQKGKGERG